MIVPLIPERITYLAVAPSSSPRMRDCAYCTNPLPSRQRDATGLLLTDKDHVFNRKMLFSDEHGNKGRNYKLKVCASCNDEKAKFEWVMSTLCYVSLPFEKYNADKAHKFISKARGSTTSSGTRFMNAITLSELVTSEGYNFIYLSDEITSDLENLVLRHVQGLYAVKFQKAVARQHLECIGSANLVQNTTAFMHPFMHFGSASTMFDIGNGAVICHWFGGEDLAWVNLTYGKQMVFQVVIDIKGATSGHFVQQR